MSQSFWSIRQLAKELGVTARTLRHYEEKHLVTPKRNGKTRLYTFEDYARLLIILRGRRLGYTITEMGEVLKMYDYKDSDLKNQMLLARAKFLERIETLKSKLRDVDESLQQLSECVRQIDGALDGQPRTPWPDFFARKFLSNHGELRQ